MVPQICDVSHQTFTQHAYRLPQPPSDERICTVGIRRFGIINLRWIGVFPTENSFRSGQTMDTFP